MSERTIEEQHLSIINNQKAREAGFLPLISNEVYERQLSPTMHVFIQYEGDVWNTWRETWKSGELKSISQKDVYMGAKTFEVALTAAKKYVGYFTKGRR